VKIERPMCCRRHENVGGRIKQDSLGNALRVKTRVHDSQDELVRSWLDDKENLKTEPTS
jgi:hypothetical protein